MILARLSICFALALLTTVAAAQTDTTFTFQGELTQHGTPANGAFNITLTLWDAASGGTQIGTADVNVGVPVVDGKFTVDVDFGATPFEDSRWLNIVLNGIALTPRTPITRAPYAIQTRGIFVNEDATSARIGPPGLASDPASVLSVVRDTTTEFGGMAVETTGPDGNPVYAYAAGGSYLAYHYVDGITGNWHLVPDASHIAVTVKPAGDVIVGEELAGNAKLEVNSSTRPVALRTTNSSAAGVGVLGVASGDDSTGVYGFVFTGSDAWGVWGQQRFPWWRGRPFFGQRQRRGNPRQKRRFLQD